MCCVVYFFTCLCTSCNLDDTEVFFATFGRYLYVDLRLVVHVLQESCLIANVLAENNAIAAHIVSSILMVISIHWITDKSHCLTRLVSLCSDNCVRCFVCIYNLVRLTHWGVYMSQRSEPSLVNAMTYCLSGAKPLPKPVRTIHENLFEHVWWMLSCPNVLTIILTKKNKSWQDTHMTRKIVKTPNPKKKWPPFVRQHFQRHF